MDLKFGNEHFANYLLGIPKKTREQVFVNIQSQTSKFKFLDAVSQIGSNPRVKLPRLTREEVKKYSSNNSRSSKPKLRSKRYKSSSSTEGQSDPLSEKHSITVEDLQSSSRHINESSSISFERHRQSSTSSDEVNHSPKEEETNISSSQNKLVLISEAKKYNKETMNQNTFSKDTVNIMSAPVEQLSVLVNKLHQKQSVDNNHQIKTTQDTSSSRKSSTALNKISMSNENRTNTKELNSTNKTNQNKPENIKKEVKNQMDSRQQSEKYKLTIVDLFGEDDSTREINIPAHKKINNTTDKPKKIFGDKNSTGDITKMRRKSICEENDERRFKSSHSRDKEEDKPANKIVARRKTICQEDSTEERRNRSKSTDKEIDVKSNKLKMVRRKTICQEDDESKLARRTSILQDAESNEDDAQRNTSKSTTPTSSKTNEAKLVRRKSIIQDIESNENDKIKRQRSRSRDKDSIPSKTNEQTIVRRKSFIQDTEYIEDKIKRSRSKSRDKEIVSSKTNEAKLVRRKSIFQDTECSKEDKINRNQSTSRDKESVASKITEAKLVRRKSIVQDTESIEDNAAKQRNTPSSKTNEEKVIRRKSIIEDIDSNKDDKVKRDISKSRDKESAASKITEAKLIRRKSIIQDIDSIEDNATKHKNKSKSEDTTPTSSKKNEEKVIRRKSIIQESESNEDVKRKRGRPKSRDKESATSKSSEAKTVRRKTIQETESNEDDKITRCRSKSRDKESVELKTNKPKLVKRKRIIQESESSEEEIIIRCRSKSRDKESVSSKSNKAKIVRKKNIIQDSDSSEDDKIKRSRSKSRNKESVTTKSNAAKIVQSNNVCKESNEDDKLNRSRGKDESSVDIKTKVKTNSKSCNKNGTVNKIQKKSEDKTIKQSKSRDIEVPSKKTTDKSKEIKHDKPSTSKIDNKASNVKSKQLLSSKNVSSISNKSLTIQPVPKSPAQTKNNFFSALKLKNNDCSSTPKRRYSESTIGCNSPASRSETSKISDNLTQDESSDSSLDTTKLTKRQKISNPVRGETSRSSSKGRNTPSRESSTDKKSTQGKSAKNDIKEAIPTSKTIKQTTDSFHKKTPNKDKKILSSNRSKSVDRQDVVPTTTTSKDEPKRDSSNIPQRMQDNENDSSSDASTIIINQRQTHRDELKEPSSTLKRRQSICESDETVESSSDCSLDAVNLDKRLNSIINEENILRTPVRRESTSTEGETTDTSSDMNLEAVKQQINNTSTRKRTTSVLPHNIEENEEALMKDSKRKKRKRAVSRCSYFGPKDGAKETLGKRKRSFSASDSIQVSASSNKHKRRKSPKSGETTPTSESNSYINYADLVEQKLVTPTSKKPIDFVAPLSASKKGFSKPHYTNDITYDSVIVIQEKENSSLKLLVRKKSKQEVEESQNRIISRRHSFHFEDITPKEEPDDSTEETIESLHPKDPKKIIKRRKSIHEMPEAMNPTKSILTRRSSESSESSTTTIKQEVVDLNDNTVLENIHSAIPVTIDLQNIDIDKMFPSTSNEDIITLEVSSDDGSPLKEGSSSAKNLQDSILSTDSAICLADIENDADERIQEDMLKKKPLFPTEINRAIGNADLQCLSTDQAVDASRDLFVSLLYIYEQYYKMMEQVESQKLLGLTPHMAIKKNYFTKRRNSDLHKIYKKLTTVKVKHFSLIVFFDRLLNLLKEEFKKYKEISEIVIIYFMQRIIWILVDNFSSPSDDQYLFNHVTSCQSVEYLIARYEHLAKDITNLDKKLNYYFNTFSKKINSQTVSTRLDALKPSGSSKVSEPVLITLKKPIAPSLSSSSVSVKKNLSLPLIDAEEPSISKPNPPKKRRGRPAKKMIHPEAIAVVPKQKLKPNPQIPNTNTHNVTGLFANINKNKSYLESRSASSKPSEESVERPNEVGPPHVRRKSKTSYEITYDNKSIKETPVQQTTENVVQERQEQRDVETSPSTSTVDGHYCNVVDENKLKSTGTQENANLTVEILELIPPTSKTPGILKQRMITVDGTIVSPRESPSQIHIETIPEKQSSTSPPKERDSVPPLNLPIGQVQPILYNPKPIFLPLQRPMTSQPVTIPAPVPAPVPLPVPAPSAFNLVPQRVKLPQIDPQALQKQANGQNESANTNVFPAMQSQNLHPVPLPKVNWPPTSQSNTVPLNLSSTKKYPCNVVPISEATQNTYNQGHKKIIGENSPVYSQRNRFANPYLAQNRQGRQQFMGQNSSVSSQSNTVVPVSQTNQDLAQNSLHRRRRKQLLDQNSSVNPQSNIFVPVSLVNPNLAQNSPNRHGREQFMGQNNSVSPQINSVVPVSQANQNLTQNSPNRHGHEQFMGQNNSVSPRFNPFVPVSQANQNLTQNSPNRQGREQFMSQNNSVGPPFNSGVPVSQANQNLIQKGPYVQSNTFIPVSQGNKNLSKICPSIQVRPLHNGQNRSSESNKPVPVSQPKPNVSQMYQNSEMLALLSGQNGPSTSQSNIVTPVSQVNPNLSLNNPSRNQSKAQNASSGPQILSDIQISQAQRNLPPLLESHSVRQLLRPHNSVTQPQTNTPERYSQNIPQMSYPTHQSIMENYPQHQMVLNGLINRPNPMYQYGPNQELVSYPVHPMYHQGTATSTYDVGKQGYHNLEYIYENAKRHALAQQHYERMIRNQMMRNPYPEKINHPVFPGGQPTSSNTAVSKDQNRPNISEPVSNPSNMVPQMMVQPQNQPAPNQIPVNHLRHIPPSDMKNLSRLGEQVHQNPVQPSTTRSVETNEQRRVQSNPVPPRKQSSSKSIDELEAMTEETINYLLNPENPGKAPNNTLIRPNLSEIERLQKELEEINRKFPVTTTANIPQSSYDMNSVTVTESSVVTSQRSSTVSGLHTIKWRMKKSVPQNDQQRDSSSADQSRQDGSVIRFQSEGHNVLRNISRDSGYLSPSDMTHQGPEQSEMFCERCMGPSRLMCSGCHTYYCSYECQQLSWPSHENKCYTIHGPTE